MSEALTAPRGLDTMSAEDSALLEQMRAADGGAPDIDAGAPDAPEAVDSPGPDIEIDLDPDPEPGPQPAARAPKPGSAQARIESLVKQRKDLEARVAAAESARIAAETKAAADAARIQERVDMLARLAEMPPAQAPAPAAPAAPPAPALPDEATDPVGYFKAVIAQQAERLKDVESIARAQAEQQRAAQEAAEMRHWATSQEMAFAKRQPDYKEAMDFLSRNRHAELEAYGYANHNERAAIIMKDVEAIARSARQSGKDFAETLYKVSSARGYAKAAPAAPAAPPEVPALDAALSSQPDDRAARAAAARDNATTIGSIGSAPPARLSVTKISDMSEAEFAAVYPKIKADPRLMREVFGA